MEYKEMIDKERVLAEFLELIGIRCSTHDEREVGDLLTKRLQELGGTVHEVKAGEALGGNCGNLVADFPATEGQEDRPTVMLTAHMDCVEPCADIHPVRENGIIRSDGTTILGAATLGVGILVGGVIFNVTGSKLSNKADEAFKQAKKEETEVRKICRYMRTLSDAESRFEDALQTVDKIYRRHLEKLGDLVVLSGKTDWNDYSDAEKKLTENTALLVGLLYSMCKVQLVLQSNSATELNRVNEEGINASRETAKNFLVDSGLAALV